MNDKNDTIINKIRNDMLLYQDEKQIVESALRAQQERESPVPCEYCREAAKIRLSQVKVTLRFPGTNVLFGMEPADALFCPMCGRELTHEPKEAQ